jgi:hypothetical protein
LLALIVFFIVAMVLLASIPKATDEGQLA